MANKEIGFQLCHEICAKDVTRIMVAIDEAYKRGQEDFRNKVADYFNVPVENMRVWVAENFPDPTIHADEYEKPRRLISSLIRALEEIRSLPIEGEK